MATIGFIGLGNMGLHMAANLVKAGHTVRAFDIVAANLDAAKAKGVEAASSANDAAKDCEAVVTMLPVGKHVIEVYSGGVLEAANKGTVFIDSSTIDVASSHEAHEMAAAAGMLSVDAPVSGGVGGAEAGTLTFMVGGTDAAFEQSKPIIEGMAGKIVNCGAAGAGQAAKICNNMIMAVSMIGAAEGFVLAEKLGLSHQALFDVVSTSSGSCWSVNNYCPVPGPVPTSPANNNFEPGFMTALMAKDLMLSQEAALQTGASTPMGAEATHLMRLYMSQADVAEKDFSSIINFIRGHQ
ncbi:MAG: 3-hydroxyisobutyrate dehydrogenase [Hyphomicrobiaceae bacterium]|jgi:3-hydroxyisobutyrate dehydrogenase